MRRHILLDVRGQTFTLMGWEGKVLSQQDEKQLTIALCWGSLATSWQIILLIHKRQNVSSFEYFLIHKIYPMSHFHHYWYLCTWSTSYLYYIKYFTFLIFRTIVYGLCFKIKLKFVMELVFNVLVAWETCETLFIDKESCGET